MYDIHFCYGPTHPVLKLMSLGFTLSNEFLCKGGEPMFNLRAYSVFKLFFHNYINVSKGRNAVS